MEENIKSKSSIFAEEGTLVHELSEMLIRNQIHIIDKGTAIPNFDKSLDEIWSNPRYYTGMEDDVAPYVDYVIGEYKSGIATKGGVSIFLEETLDLTEYIQEAFGTGDAIIIKGDLLEVIDLKFGKGVKVSPVNNDQLKIYGLGSLSKYEILYTIKTVRLTVAQPRLGNIESWDISRDALVEWGETELIEKALIAFDGEGDLNPGSWCKFCKVKYKCRAIADLNMELAKKEFRDPRLLSDQELLDIYHKEPIFTDWIKSVGEHIFSEALSGKKWSGLKIVQGRSNRSWLNPDEVISTLTSEKYGFEKEQVTDTKLKGLGEITKLMGKKSFESFSESYTTKPEGKPTLVADTDPRPEFEPKSASEDFASEDNFLD
jgi:hypothetical protein